MPYEQDCVPGVTLARGSPVTPEKDKKAERTNAPSDILGTPAENQPRVSPRCAL